MRIQACDVCGKVLYPIKEEMPRRFYIDDDRGWFSIEYQRAVKDKDGKIIGADYTETHICPDCHRKANEKIWEVFEPIIAKKNKTAEVTLPQFPMEPVRCAEPVRCVTPVESSY